MTAGRAAGGVAAESGVGRPAARIAIGVTPTTFRAGITSHVVLRRRGRRVTHYNRETESSHHATRGGGTRVASLAYYCTHGRGPQRHIHIIYNAHHRIIVIITSSITQ